MMDPRRKSAAVEPTPHHQPAQARHRHAPPLAAGRSSESSQSLSSRRQRESPNRSTRHRPRANDIALDAHARILLSATVCSSASCSRASPTHPSGATCCPSFAASKLAAKCAVAASSPAHSASSTLCPRLSTRSALRAASRSARDDEAPIVVAAADPLNLAGILVPGERVPAVPGREVRFRNGAVVEEDR